jgi:probable F420-dependent oxidoreductase
MKFGIVNIFPPARAALDNMRLAERLDFDTFWLTDSHVIWNECYSHFGWLIAQSESNRLQFGTMVTNPVSRDPIVVASAFATLQDLSGGRMLCGIGRGDSSVRVLKRPPATVKAFERAATMIRTLTHGEQVEIEGVAARLDWADAGGVPLCVAAYGPRMLELAGRVGDAVIIECADPHYIRWALERVHHGAREAGKDPAHVQVITSTATFVSDDLAAARDQVRSFGALVGNHVAEVLRNLGSGNMPPELEAFITDRPEYDYLEHVKPGTEQSKYVPDEIIDRLCIVGTPEHCLARVRELEELGITHINFYAQTDDYAGQMEVWAKEIIPQVREASVDGIR